MDKIRIASELVKLAKEMIGSKTDKSQGHLAFMKGLHGQAFEYFMRQGNVYRAEINEVVMPDGFRSGRWECSAAHWATDREMLIKDAGEDFVEDK